jgi:hypothetical protein
VIGRLVPRSYTDRARGRVIALNRAAAAGGRTGRASDRTTKSPLTVLTQTSPDWGPRRSRHGVPCDKGPDPWVEYCGREMRRCNNRGAAAVYFSTNPSVFTPRAESGALPQTEAGLSRNTQANGRAVIRCRVFAIHCVNQQGLRMQGFRHVDAAPEVIKGIEDHPLRLGACIHQLQDQ